MIEEQHKTYMEKGPSRISPFMIPMMIANEAAGQVSILLGLKGPNSCTVTACRSGANAIGGCLPGDPERGCRGNAYRRNGKLYHPLGIGGFCALKALSRRNDAPPKASRPFDKR